MSEYFVLVHIGFFIAFAIGLTGIGTGTLTAPTLIMLGLDPSKAVGSALTFSTIVKFPAALFIGSYLLSRISFSQSLKNLILLAIGITIILSIALNSLFFFKNKRIDLTKWLRNRFYSAGTGALGMVLLLLIVAVNLIHRGLS